LFLSCGDVSQHTDILREDVLASADGRDGRFVELLVSPLRVGALTRDGILFKLTKNVSDLQTFLKVVVLVGVDQLKIFSTVEDNCVILVIWLAIAEGGISRKLYTELGPAFP
jgi:hypothetical protein